jgi:hypothetical protein
MIICTASLQFFPVSDLSVEHHPSSAPFICHFKKQEKNSKHPLGPIRANLGPKNQRVPGFWAENGL